MKIKFTTGLISTIFLLTFFVNLAYGQLPLPTITTACETKTGLLYGFNDGFSLLKECRGQSRRVILIGEKGPKGEQGDQGQTGQTGPAGLTGPMGNTGVQGDTGSQGPTGPQGYSGPTGPQGPQGQRGITGAGNIAFIEGNYVLTTDGTVWHYNSDTAPYWIHEGPAVPFPVSSIVQWSHMYVLDTNGNVWKNDGSSWINRGHP